MDSLNGVKLDSSGQEKSPRKKLWLVIGLTGVFFVAVFGWYYLGQSGAGGSNMLFSGSTRAPFANSQDANRGKSNDAVGGNLQSAPKNVNLNESNNKQFSSTPIVPLAPVVVSNKASTPQIASDLKFVETENVDGTVIPRLDVVWKSGDAKGDIQEFTLQFAMKIKGKTEIKTMPYQVDWPSVEYNYDDKSYRIKPNVSEYVNKISEETDLSVAVKTKLWSGIESEYSSSKSFPLLPAPPKLSLKGKWLSDKGLAQLSTFLPQSKYKISQLEVIYYKNVGNYVDFGSFSKQAASFFSPDWKYNSYKNYDFKIDMLKENSDYCLRLRARNDNGQHSEWSDPLCINTAV